MKDAGLHPSRQYLMAVNGLSTRLDEAAKRFLRFVFASAVKIAVVSVDVSSGIPERA